jgi:hypothetical protein
MSASRPVARRRVNVSMVDEGSFVEKPSRSPEPLGISTPVVLATAAAAAGAGLAAALWPGVAAGIGAATAVLAVVTPFVPRPRRRG